VIAVEAGEVDGVRAFWADLPGRVRGGLVFRAGQADATLATNGIPHLAEHLAIASLGGDAVAHGEVTPLTLGGDTRPGDAAPAAQELLALLGDELLRRLDAVDAAALRGAPPRGARRTDLPARA